MSQSLNAVNELNNSWADPSQDNLNYICPDYINRFIEDFKKNTRRPLQVTTVNHLPKEVGGYTIEGERTTYLFVNAIYRDVG